MLVEYYGHSCFALTDGQGRRVILDPYDPSVGYGGPHRPADLTLISHAHFDHDHVAAVPGRTQVVRAAGPRRFKEIALEGFLADHDGLGGTQLGHVTVYRLEIDGRVVVHLSDLGAPPSPELKRWLGRPDLLLIPCGGAGYTLGPSEAAALVREIRPRRVIPMHYRTPVLNRARLPDLVPVEPFLEEFGARPLRQSTLEIDDPGPEEPEIVALSHMF